MNSSKLRILIADDNNSDRMILDSIIRQQGHSTVLASDGLEAVDLFQQKKPDLILLDAMMPNLDGFGAAKKIKDLAGDDLIPIIFLTSLHDASSLAKALESGGDDFLSKPYNKIILQAKISAFDRMRTLHTTVMEQRDEIMRHHEHLMLEQKVAKGIFDNIAHPGCLEAEDIKYLLSPMAVFNGDILLAAKNPSGNLLVFLGDFTGHGLPAAIGAMPVSDTFYNMTQKGYSLENILQEINEKLKNILPVGVFCCASIIEVKHRDKAIEVWNGGLPDSLIYRVDGEKVENIESRHLPLGILPPHKFEATPKVFQFNQGDKIYLWSDGIHEEENADGVMFGCEELARVFQENQNASELFDELINSVRQFSASTEQSDDYSVVEVTQNETVTAEEEIDHSILLTNSPNDWTIKYELGPGTLKNSNPLPLLVQLLMEMPGLRAHSGHVYTILSELYSNALEHGVLGISSSLKETPEGFAKYYEQRCERLADLKKGYVRFELQHEPDEQAYGGTLTIRVEDSGTGFEWQQSKVGNIKRKGYCGRGIPLVNFLCDDIQYLGKGNEVLARFHWRL